MGDPYSTDDGPDRPDEDRIELSDAGEEAGPNLDAITAEIGPAYGVTPASKDAATWASVQADDVVLLAAARAGDKDALTHLLQRHFRAIVAAALPLVAGASDPIATLEDVVAETWLAAWEKFDDFRGDLIHQWLWKIAERKAIDSLRNQLGFESRQASTYDPLKHWVRAEPISDVTCLHVGDPLVHEDYGVGRFAGIEVRNDVQLVKVRYHDPRFNIRTVASAFVHEKLRRYVSLDGEPAPFHYLKSQWVRRVGYTENGRHPEESGDWYAAATLSGTGRTVGPTHEEDELDQSPAAILHRMGRAFAAADNLGRDDSSDTSKPLLEALRDENDPRIGRPLETINPLTKILWHEKIIARAESQLRERGYLEQNEVAEYLAFYTSPEWLAAAPERVLTRAAAVFDRYVAPLVAELGLKVRAGYVPLSENRLLSAIAFLGFVAYPESEPKRRRAGHAMTAGMLRLYGIENLPHDCQSALRPFISEMKTDRMQQTLTALCHQLNKRYDAGSVAHELLRQTPGPDGKWWRLEDFANQYTLGRKAFMTDVWRPEVVHLALTLRLIELPWATPLSPAFNMRNLRALLASPDWVTDAVPMAEALATHVLPRAAKSVPGLRGVRAEDLIRLLPR